MSPESQKPQNTDQESAFNTELHPEGVRAFKQGDLSDVADQLTVHDDISVLSPDTHEVSFDKVPIVEKKSHKGLYASIAGVAAAATAVVGFAVAQSGADSEKPQARQTASAPANPGSEVSNEPATPEAGIGIPGTTLETLNTKPSEALVQEALQPVTVADYPTPEQAVQHFGLLINLRNLSGSVDAGFEETPESVAQRNQIDSVIFEGTTPTYLEDENNLRQLISAELYVMGDKDLNMYPSNDKTGTWRTSWEATSVIQNNGDEYLMAVTENLETNLGEIDVTLQSRMPHINTKQTTGTVDIVKANGEWHIRTYTITDPVVAE